MVPLYLSYRYKGTVFNDVRDKIRVVFPLNFLECKGTYLRVSKLGYLLIILSRLVSYLSIPKDITAYKSS